MAKSSVLTAIALLIAFNLGMKLFVPPEDHDGAFSTLQLFQCCEAQPHVVFLGSSLSKHVFAALTKSERINQRIGSLSYNLQLPSDSFLLVTEYLHDRTLPRRIILPVGPRDFYDNDALPIYRTATFKELIPWHTAIRNLPLYATSADEVLVTSLERVCPLYSHRLGIARRLVAAFESGFNLLGYTSPAPHLPKSLQQPWSRSIAEYRWRYQGISLERMSTQFSFLQRLIDVCRTRGIEVVVVNVPLSNGNRALLPQNLESKFRQRLQSLSSNANVKFIDAANGQAWNDEDFMDSAHLNLQGARKVIALIAKETDLSQTRVVRANRAQL